MEEKELIKLAKQGNKEAQEVLIQQHKGFIVKFCSRYKNLGVDLEDLIMEGTIGLLNGLKNFDDAKNVKFLTYASYWIKKAVLGYLSENCSSHILSTLSLDYTYKNADVDSNSLMDGLADQKVQPPEQNLLDVKFPELLSRHLHELSESERKVMILRYGLDGENLRGIKETARLMNITREKVRSIECRVIKKINDIEK